LKSLLQFECFERKENEYVDILLFQIVLLISAQLSKVNGEDPKRFMKDIGLRVGKVKFVTDEGDLEDDMYLLDYEEFQKH